MIKVLVWLVLAWSEVRDWANGWQDRTSDRLLTWCAIRRTRATCRKQGHDWVMHGRMVDGDWLSTTGCYRCGKKG